MKSFWFYQCDEAHHWVVLRDSDAEEREEDIYCPFGHEAVTLQKRPLNNQIELRVVSGTHFVDTIVRNPFLYGRGTCHVTVVDLISGETYSTNFLIPWEKIKDRMESYLSMSFDAVCFELKQLSPDSNT